MWFLLLLPILSWAQTESDLDAIQDLENILPESEIRRTSYKNVEYERKFRGFRPPERTVTLDEIKPNGKSYGFMKKGTVIYRITDNAPLTISKDIYTRFYLNQDDQGFIYLVNKNKTTTYKVRTEHLVSVEQEMALYEPPTRYAPAENIVRTEYDRKLRLVPETAFYLGVVQAQYLKDLFNDPKAGSGTSTQYALHYFTEWNLPAKVGASLHYEKATFNLSGRGTIAYDSVSFGPQFRSKDFDFFETDWRVTGQIRVSPFARVRGESGAGEESFKFNSTDLMFSLDHPWKNRWGQFVIGGYYQMQWLNIKDAPETVSIRATNKTNQSFGLFLSQVFQ